MNRFTQSLLIIIGTVFVALGILGIFLPLLPTTPFLLLGASCYVKGSEQLYNWLIHNRFLGEYIKNYREKKGIPMKAKLLAISMLWTTMSYSLIFIVSNTYVKALLLFIAVVVTWHVASQKALEQVMEEEETQEQQGIEREEN
ncbi:MAG: hypothetical protein K0Q65_1160 [Clostridia bacterium]|jgi:uncharacterized membrane protein YbaN (DUF454 family)|nr:hypothetical protein [Clostridia bacterium]